MMLPEPAHSESPLAGEDPSLPECVGAWLAHAWERLPA